MQFHILDENNTPVAVMDNALPEAIHFKNSKFHRFLTGSADFFDFDISKLHVDHSLLQVGYWIAFKYGNRDNLLYISDIEEAERDKMISISSMSQNLDLNLENTPAFSADKSYPIKWYFDRILFDTGYEIGINEISDLSRKLSWDSDMTYRVFLQSVATQFDNAELDYEVQLNSDFTIKKRLIHIKKQIGEVREDLELRYGQNIKSIKRKTSINPIYTAIRPISKDDNDKITTIADYPEWKALDENGNIKFYHKKGEEVIKAPLANARFGNRGTNVTAGGYIVYDYSFDKISQSELFNRSSKMLEDLSVPAVSYDAEGKTGANVGDTVKIVDDGYSPQLIVSARVLEQIISFDDASLEQANFGNYKALESRISDDILAKMQKLAEDSAPYNMQTLASDGLQFKNSTGNTLLTAKLYKGTREIVPDKYVWTKDGSELSGSTGQRDIAAADVNQKSVFRWSAVINGNVVAFDEVTITDVSDGKKGPPGIAGDAGNGVKSTDVKYQISASGTATPTQAWTASIPALTKGQYLWTRTTWTYENDTSKTGYSISYISVDGDKGDPTGIAKSGTEPTTRFADMIWYVDSVSDVSSQNMASGTTALSHTTYTWKNSKWVQYMIRSTNLEVDKSFINEAMISDAAISNSKIKDETIESAKIKSLEGEKILADSLDLISNNLGTMKAGAIKFFADIIINTAGKTKKFGMLFTKKGLVSSGPSYRADSTVSDTKMAVANLTQGELRFANTNYSEDIEQVQDTGVSSASAASIRFSSTEDGDILEINSSGRIRLNGSIQTSPWIDASAFAKYRVSFGTVMVSVSVTNGSGTSAAIYLGNIPKDLRPLDGRMLYAGAWWPDTSRDRHFQINRGDGNMSLLNPYPGQLYKFEVEWGISN